jgi:hypothetical protein
VRVPPLFEGTPRAVPDTSYQGELLSVGYEKIDERDGLSKLLTLWNSSKIMGETGEGH